jgi:hypothetical protein
LSNPRLGKHSHAPEGQQLKPRVQDQRVVEAVGADDVENVLAEEPARFGASGYPKWYGRPYWFNVVSINDPWFEFLSTQTLSVPGA